MVDILNNWLTHWYPLFWSVLFILETFFAGAAFYILVKEYKYDEAKDIAKKQRRTKTTKKTTVHPGGDSISEETTEIEEPTNEERDTKRES